MLSAIEFFMEQQGSASTAVPKNIVRTSTKILKISNSIHILSEVNGEESKQEKSQKLHS